MALLTLCLLGPSSPSEGLECLHWSLTLSMPDLHGPKGIDRYEKANRLGYVCHPFMGFHDSIKRWGRELEVNVPPKVATFPPSLFLCPLLDSQWADSKGRKMTEKWLDSVFWENIPCKEA